LNVKLRDLIVPIVASFISSLFLGIFSGFQPLELLSQFFFGKSLPDYLAFGWQAIALFSLYYPLLLVFALYPAFTILKIREEVAIPQLSRPSKEDLVFLPIIYVIYIWTLYNHDLLTINTAAIGIVAILLPIVYRMTVYSIDASLEKFREVWFYPWLLFVVSLVFAVPVSILYLHIVYILT